MNAGAMRQTISIYRRAMTQGDNGYMTPEETPVCTVRARRYFATTREVWLAYAAQTRNVVNFEIRRRADINAGMWVLCRGQWHEIIAVQADDGAASMIVKTTLKESR